LVLIASVLGGVFMKGLAAYYDFSWFTALARSSNQLTTFSRQRGDTFAVA
jgi:hypothetical protein